MNLRTYSVSDLRRIISESSQEFKPVLGKDVEKDNKKINDEAYKEIAKETGAYDGGLSKKMSKDKISMPKSDNRGMQDLKYDLISDEFKERVKSQMKGFTSTDDEKKHKDDAFGNAEFKDVEGLDKEQKDLKDKEIKLKTSGLTSKELDKKELSDSIGKRVYENKITKIRFKNTTFITENHMISRIPDEYKVEGKKFIMEDKNNTEYLVEWSEEPKILNTTKSNEQQARIKELFGYKRNDVKSTCYSRINEDNKINDMLGKVRKLMD